MSGEARAAAPAGARTGARLAITILAPLAVLVATRYVPLPRTEGIRAAAARDGSHVADAALGIFALGILPVVTAYGLVEIIAFLVPRLSRLRHGDPVGRAKLDRAAKALAILIAGVQAFGVANTLAYGFPLAEDAPPRWLVTASLTAGVCVLMLVADLVTKQRVANGYLVLVVVGALEGLVERGRASIGRAAMLGVLEPKTFVVLGGMLVLPAVATFVALRDRGARSASPAQEAPAATDGAPYRTTRAIEVRPWVPVPASSLAALTIAASILSLPSLLASWIPGFPVAPSVLTGPGATFAVVEFIVTAIVAVVLARLLHRPRETSDVLARLGVPAGPDTALRARDTLRAALPPTLLFFATLSFAAAAGAALPFKGPSLSYVPLAIAVLLDVVAALRRPAMVPVWEERRASAIPLVRAVLEGEGIASETRGMATLSLLQVFAPYAPATIVVAPEDATRALARLGDPAAGGGKADTMTPTAMPTGAPIAPTPATSKSKSGSTRSATTVLAIAAPLAIALAGLAGARLRPHAPEGPRRELEVVRVDDYVDPFDGVDPHMMPPGIDLRSENIPVGPGHSRQVHYALAVAQAGETVDQTFLRAKSFSDSIQLPAGARFGLEPAFDFDPHTLKSSLAGVRTIVLVGAPVLTTNDVVDATVTIEPSMQNQFFVAVTLGSDGARRFEQVTGEWVERRLAIVLDGRVSSAPVIKSRIPGGRISITMGRGDPEEMREKAFDLAHGLGGR